MKSLYNFIKKVYNTVMSLKYYIKTYGCQMNAHESEKLAGILEKSNYAPAENIENADLIVLNTCCVRETAETHILGNLGIIKKLKEKRPSLKVAVCGCMTQANGAAEKLKKRCPFIDMIIGTHNTHEFTSYLERINGGEKFIEVWEHEKDITEGSPIKRSGKVSALVNIMYGCDNFCSYCIVPYVRGRERSRDPKNIIADVEQLVLQGYKEITLLGQNVNSYGHGDTDFAALLDAVSDIEGEYWIKFLTSHPKDLSEKVVDMIAEKEHLAHFIHLPLQSGSTRILKLMNRKYSRDEYLKKISMIKSKLPDVSLSCDIMVGFPTETEDDFLETLDTVKTVEYSNLFPFIYSPRTGTPASSMPQVPIDVKKERIKRLIDCQFPISQRIAQKSLGKTLKVLCDGTEDGNYVGKTQTDKKVVFTCETDPIGSFRNVKITSAKNSKLYGTADTER